MLDAIREELTNLYCIHSDNSKKVFDLHLNIHTYYQLLEEYMCQLGSLYGSKHDKKGHITIHGTSFKLCINKYVGNFKFVENVEFKEINNINAEYGIKELDDELMTVINYIPMKEYNINQDVARYKFNNRISQYNINSFNIIKEIEKEYAYLIEDITHKLDSRNVHYKLFKVDNIKYISIKNTLDDICSYSYAVHGFSEEGFNFRNQKISSNLNLVINKIVDKHKLKLDNKLRKMNLLF